MNAQGRLATLANVTAARLSFGGDAVMHLTVATPGMWTDRLATEVEHRLLGSDRGGVLWWFDESGGTGRWDSGAAEVLDVLADDPSLSSMVGFLYGDDAARALGFTSVGLGPHVGEHHAVALAHRSHVPAAAE